METTEQRLLLNLDIILSLPIPDPKTFVLEWHSISELVRTVVEKILKFENWMDKQSTVTAMVGMTKLATMTVQGSYYDLMDYLHYAGRIEPQ